MFAGPTSRPALRGYDKARVDEFRDRVANELERLTRLNQELECEGQGLSRAAARVS